MIPNPPEDQPQDSEPLGLSEPRDVEPAPLPTVDGQSAEQAEAAALEASSDSTQSEAISAAPTQQISEMPNRPADPWAHRRGEPRVFAFFWSMYLLLAVAGSVSWVARTSELTPDSYGPAARIMLIVVAVGATVLWPMTRLSQASPARGVVAHTLADFVVVLVPLQMVVWPLIVLARWPLPTVASVAVLLGAWTLLTGGVLANALGGRSMTQPGAPGLGTRSAWMVVFVIMALAAPALLLALSGESTNAQGSIVAGSQRSASSWLSMLSPLSAVSQLTGRGISGPQRPVSTLEWSLIGWVAIAGVWMWIVAGVREGFARLREPA